MNTNNIDNIKDLYAEGDEWIQNLGEKTIHAKRSKGRFRAIKWLSSLVWIPFFTFAYITYNGKQAILFDVENRQYHLFDITIFPQDIWLLTMVLLFFAILLAVMTTLLGRVFCGYFCFQTVWTDVFTKIEEFIEGPPAKRRKLDKESFNVKKVSIKLTKHIIWLAIGILSGVSWMLYFGVSWVDYINGDVTSTTLTITGSIALGVYIFAGFMREQTCLWICPYARIQGAMVDKDSILPTYDNLRGEKRGKLKKGKAVEGFGDCIDCNQCIAVCPTGVDIRRGQEYGCITCGLCIDACDNVMQKIDKPTGLIRYTSYTVLHDHKKHKPFYKRFRVILYSTVLFIAATTLTYNLANLSPLELKILHGRQPLFALLTNGSLRNKYEVKVMNKNANNLNVNINIISDIDHLKIKGETKNILIKPGELKSIIVYLSAFKKDIKDNKIKFIVGDKDYKLTYISKFFY